MTTRARKPRSGLKRLLLIRHAATAATRAAEFPADEPLDERGHRTAVRLAGVLPSGCSGLSSPALRCLQTAEAAGLGVRAEPALAECDFGDWAGRSLAEVQANDAAAAAAWMTDARAAPHGGESLAELAGRVRGWLDAQAEENGATVAITHAGVVRVALVHALGAPLEAFWRFDAAPLSVSELHARDGRWTVAGVNRPAPARGAL